MLGYDALGRLPLGQVRSGAAVTTLVFSFSNAETVSLRRTGTKYANVTQGQTVTLRRALGKLVNVLQDQTVTLARNLAHGVTASLAQVVTLGRNLAHGASITSGETVTLRKQTSKPAINITQGETVTIVTRKLLPWLITITQDQTVTLARNLARGITLQTLFPAASLTKGTNHRVVTTPWSETVTLRRQSVKNINITQTLIFLVKNLLASNIKVMQGQAITTTQNQSGKLLIVMGINARVFKFFNRPVISITMNNTLRLIRQTAHSVFATNNQTVTLGNTLLKFIGILQGQLVILKTFNYRNIKMTMGQVVTVGRNMSTSLYVLQNSLVTVVRSVYHKVLYSLSQTITTARNQGKPVFVVLSQLVSLRRSILKLVRTYTGQSVYINNPRERKPFITQGQSVRVLRGTGHAVTLITLNQTVRLLRGVAHRVLLSQAQAVSTARRMSHAIRAALSQVITLRRNMQHYVMMSSLSQSVTVRRAMRRTVRVTNGLGQLVSVVAYPVHHYLVRVAVSIGQAVTLFTGNRGKWLGISQAQAITVSRIGFKYIFIRTKLVLEFSFNALVRKLVPSLFAFGLARKRSVYEVPRVANTNILTPPIEPVVEFENVEFDYGLVLDEGVTITAATVTATVFDGDDTNPSNILISYPVVGNSTRTGQPKQSVVQEIGNTVNLNTYRLQCAARCSDGQVKVLSALIQSVVS